MGGRLVRLLLHPQLILQCHLIPMPREPLPQPQESSQAPLLLPKSFGNVAVSSVLQGAESFWGFGGAWRNLLLKDRCVLLPLSS